MPISANVTNRPITASVGETQIDVSVGSPQVTASVSGGFGPSGVQGPSGVVTVSAPVTNSGTSSAANIGLAVGAGLSTVGGALVVSYGTTAGTACQGNDARLSDARTPLSHTHTASQITDFTTAVIAAAPPTTNASLLTSGTLPDARLSSNIARTTDVSSAVAALVNSAPATLDTLNELAAALGNDASFATTVTNSLAGKAPTSHSHDASAINAGTLAADRLPLASANTRGAVRIGAGVSIDGDGVISVSIPSLDWASITNKPSTFAPSAHKTSHATGGSDALTAADIGAAAASHAHAWSDITSGVPSTFTPSSHSHGNLSNDGLVNGNTTSGQIVVTTTGGALTTAATISSSAVSGLGGAATLNVGTTAGTVAAGDHTHSQLHDRSHAITSSSDHTATAWRVFYSNASGVVTELALGSSGQALISQGASAAPTWGAAGSNSASDLTTGTLAFARLAAKARSAANLYLWSSFR